MNKSIVIGSFIALAGASAALADTKVGDWTVSRNQDTKEQCLAVRNYVDEEDKNLKNSVVLSLIQNKVIIVLGYQAWKWDKGEKEQTSLSVNGDVVIKQMEWTSSAPQTLTAVVDKTSALTTALSKGKTLSIKFDDGDDAEFNIPRAGEVMTALQTCVDTK